MMAARALGFECGPMSGFNKEAVECEFWRYTAVKTNFICGIGRGDPTKFYQRHPRFDFAEVAKIL
jgi:3-hydroxypropanoate dehydrogenase